MENPLDTWERQRKLKGSPFLAGDLVLAVIHKIIIACHMSFFGLFSILQNLRALVAMNENLKSQEQEFKAHCRVSVAWCQQTLSQESCNISCFPSPCPDVASCPGAVRKGDSCPSRFGVWLLS